MFIKLRNNELLRPQKGGFCRVILCRGERQKVCFALLFLLFLLSAPLGAAAQTPVPSRPKKTIAAPAAMKHGADSAARPGKTVVRPAAPRRLLADSTRTDTLGTGDADALIPLSPNAITDVIHYKATDSIAINLDRRQATLYNDGDIDYDGMELKADEIVVDFNRQTLHARGTADSAGGYTGRPYFKQGAAEYNADTLTFNYSTKKGIINGVITQEGEGFLHGNKVKKMN